LRGEEKPVESEAKAKEENGLKEEREKFSFHGFNGK